MDSNDKHTQYRGSSRIGIDEMPSFFTKERLMNNPTQFEIEPLENGKGFEYCGIHVEVDLPFGEWEEFSFFIDPSLPTFLFIERYRDTGTVRVSGHGVSLVVTDMSFFCPGIRVDVNHRGVFVKKKE